MQARKARTISMTDLPGRFRINWVAETTGVPEATLRAWERRYQVPKPSRTPSGYRLYSEQDVAQVHKMRELCEAGISAADAAREVLTDRDDGRPAAPLRPASAPDNAPPTGDEVKLAEIVAAEHTNSAGVLALHRAISLMERAASVAATRGTRSSAIVVSCGGIDMFVAVGTGQLVEATAQIVAVRGASITVDVELVVENVKTGQRERVARTTFALMVVSE
jgi:DNA-binding transcriptional MerR regulator